MVGTRHRFITATNELFRRNGFNATSLKEVTAAAGAPIGSLYHFFPGGKRQLAEAVIVETGESYRQLFELIADAAPDPAAAIGDFFEGAAAILEESDFIDVCPIGSLAREIASTDDRLRRATDAVFAGWTTAAADRFAAAGLDRPEADALAVTVIAALEGGFVLARAGRDGDRLRSIGAHMRALVADRLVATQPVAPRPPRPARTHRRDP